ncbi:MAG: MarR family transcriptional regulator [Lachnospiraceae bacterium]|nr:MarR family transcriptional regulator [Lachnospiraceae bacterium]
MKSQGEALLEAWLQLSTAINNSRLVSELSFNESLICNLLYQNLRDDSASRMTATDLCAATKMQKSLMNRTLKQLESKGVISRERSTEDMRRIYIYLNHEQTQKYRIQHNRILDMINELIRQLGPDKTASATSLFREIALIANETFYE